MAVTRKTRVSCKPVRTEEPCKASAEKTRKRPPGNTEPTPEKPAHQPTAYAMTSYTALPPDLRRAVDRLTADLRREIEIGAASANSHLKTVEAGISDITEKVFPLQTIKAAAEVYRAAKALEKLPAVEDIPVNWSSVEHTLSAALWSIYRRGWNDCRENQQEAPR